MKPCAFCEAEFEVKYPTRHRFCSRDCQVRAWRDTLWLRRRQK